MNESKGKPTVLVPPDLKIEQNGDESIIEEANRSNCSLYYGL